MRRKQRETKLMMWARIIKNCPHGGGEVIVRDGESINSGWPKKYEKFGALRRFQVNRVKNYVANGKAPAKKGTANG